MQFYSNGKFLLTGEYFVLKGALSLALPLTKGQTMFVSNTSKKRLLEWKAYDLNDQLWFTSDFDIETLQILACSHMETASILQDLLKSSTSINPAFLSDKNSVRVETKLTFPLEWGMGSSSTLITNLSEWAEINPFDLMKRSKSFLGSGYDLACAKSQRAIVYDNKESKASWREINFDVPFKDNLYFVYLGNKMSTKKAIEYYNTIDNPIKSISDISHITKEIISVKSLDQFEYLLKEHEKIVSKTLGIPMISESVFSDYKDGIVKSLGAWGGDFVMFTGNENTPNYLSEKGFKIVIPYSEIII
ncbi:GYDIA family GHMP kinase [Ichthyobacterium seriolicida]|nr:GYDIA family GHMP kinase [Ichthyobacterium seriolicida]